MRIRLLSDLHLECAPFDPPPADADVVVLAGDIQTKRRGVRWARAAFPGLPVIYVGGNHEPYTDKLPNVLTALREEGAACDVHVLEREAVVVAGVRFVGCTLWTDLRLFARTPDDPPDYARAEHAMNDYVKIRVAPTYAKLRARGTVAMHHASVQWLRARFAEPFAGPTVVVTHHPPSARSLDPRTAADPDSIAYASHLDDLVAASGAALWCHGHTHVAVDYRIGTTRVVANQRGYPDEPAPGFDPSLVLTL